LQSQPSQSQLSQPDMTKNPKKHDHLQFTMVQEEFISTLIKRLNEEQEQRLKTEEQSANIIEEMARTLLRHENEDKKSSHSESVIFPHQTLFSPIKDD